MINADDLHLVHLTDDVDDAVEHITGFFANYHSMRYVGRRLVVRHRHPLTDDQLAAVNAEFADIVVRGGFQRVDAAAPEIADDDALDQHRLAFEFDQFGNARLRRLIDHLNRLAPGGGDQPSG
jgi:hypothetical protein